VRIGPAHIISYSLLIRSVIRRTEQPLHATGAREGREQIEPTRSNSHAAAHVQTSSRAHRAVRCPGPPRPVQGARAAPRLISELIIFRYQEKS
jgi:hypothetical protein